MSTQAIKWALRQGEIDASHKTILLALAWHANELGKAWLTIETLVAESCASESTVHRALRSFLARGWLKDTGERLGQTKQIRVYEVNLKGVTVTDLKGVTVTDLKGVTVTEKGVTVTEKGVTVTGFHSNIEKQYKNNYIKHPPSESEIQNGNKRRNFAFEDAQNWINSLFRRRLRWSYQEEQLLSELLPIAAEDRALLSWGYTLPRDREGWALVDDERMTKPKQTVLLFLEQFSSEIDKWRGIRRNHQVEDEPQEGDGWTPERLALRDELFPNQREWPAKFESLSVEVQRGFVTAVRAQKAKGYA